MSVSNGQDESRDISPMNVLFQTLVLGGHEEYSLCAPILSFGDPIPRIFEGAEQRVWGA